MAAADLRGRGVRWPTRLFAYLVILAVLVPPVVHREAWPFTTLRLFSDVRRAEQTGWAVTTVAPDGQEHPVQWDRLPRAYRFHHHLLARVQGSTAERQAVCAQWIEALRVAGSRDVGSLRIYRVPPHPDGRRPAPYRRPPPAPLRVRAVRPVRVIDAWLFAENTAARLRRVRALLALLIAARLAFSPLTRLADTPDALFVPISDLVPFRSVPSAGVIVAVQVIGALAALVVVIGRRFTRPAFAVAWLSLLALAGLKSSQGKILHNDVLLLLAAMPFLLAPDARDADDDESSPAYGWPIRTSMVVIAASYFIIGVQKLVHSGIDWVASDNMRWVLYAAAAGDRPWSSIPARFVADRPWLAMTSAALLLATELAMPLALFVRSARPVLVAAAVGLHVGTWLLLGLDYWLWAAAVPVVFLIGEPVGGVTRPDPSGRRLAAGVRPR